MVRKIPEKEGRKRNYMQNDTTVKDQRAGNLTGETREKAVKGFKTRYTGGIRESIRTGGKRANEGLPLPITEAVS